MAAITDPNAVRFSNESIRPGADRQAQLYYFAKATVDEWYANNLGAIFVSGEGPVEDGSPEDGRYAIMADDALFQIQFLEAFVADYEANNDLKLVSTLKVSPNPTP